MRGRHRRHRVSQTRIPGERTDAREAVERRWYSALRPADELAGPVTAAGARREPYHRWIVLKQSFSPDLVRLFLRETGATSPARRGPVLDPFSGTGTTVLECARLGVSAIGIDPSPALGLVVSAGAERRWSRAPTLDVGDPLAAARDLSGHLERAALLCAIAARHSSEGKLRKNAPSLSVAFADAVRMIEEDLRQPLSQRPLTTIGDGRRLDFLRDGSISGLLTSPPYLSRHRYPRLTKPIDELYATWHPRAATPGAPDRYLPAHPRAVGNTSGPVVDHAAVAEAAETLTSVGNRRAARAVRQYFAGLVEAFAEYRRVSMRDAACWIVVGGARLADVYVPTDTILADEAERAGFEVTDLRVARRLIPAGRRFGSLNNVSPRETVLCLRCT